MSVVVSTYPKPIDDIKALLKLFGMDPDMNSYNSQNSKANIAEILGIDPVSVVQSWNMLPPEAKHQMRYMMNVAEMSSKEKVLMAMPYYPAIQ